MRQRPRAPLGPCLGRILLYVPKQGPSRGRTGIGSGISGERGGEGGLVLYSGGPLYYYITTLSHLSPDTGRDHQPETGLNHRLNCTCVGSVGAHPSMPWARAGSTQIPRKVGPAQTWVNAVVPSRAIQVDFRPPTPLKCAFLGPKCAFLGPKCPYLRHA